MDKFIECMVYIHMVEPLKYNTQIIYLILLLHWMWMRNVDQSWQTFMISLTSSNTVLILLVTYWSVFWKTRKDILCWILLYAEKKFPIERILNFPSSYILGKHLDLVSFIKYSEVKIPELAEWQLPRTHSKVYHSICQ